MSATDGKAALAPQPQSAAAPSPFPPIADYAFLSDCHTGALVAPDGTIDWLCVPRFDSPSVFGSLLDRQAGAFRLGPFGINVPAARVVRARHQHARDDVEDAERMGRGPRRADDGPAPQRGHGHAAHAARRPTTTPTTCSCAPSSASRAASRSSWCASRCSTTAARPPSGRWSATTATRRTRTAARPAIRLHTDMALGIEGNRVRARHVLREGENLFCSLSWEAGPGLAGRRRGGERAARRHDALLARLAGPGAPARPPLARADQRSALAIKGLTYMPTGATVAALTTSLPETPGGERNWDYRYTWMRDSTFTLQALHWLNLDWEADEFMQFVADLEANDDGALQIMYGIDGRRDLTESTRDDLSGYAGAQPVRIGNGAFDQRQNDVFGAVLDSILPAHAAAAGACRGGCGRSCRRRPSARRASGASPTRASGRRAAPRSTTSPPSSCAGSRSTARPSWPRSRGEPALQATWGATADGDPRRHPRARGRRARRPAPALRHRRARRLDAAGRDRSGSSRPTTSGCGRACWRSPTS